jgi:hypothetical protein
MCRGRLAEDRDENRDQIREVATLSMSASASCGHACRIGLGRLVPQADSCSAAKPQSLDHFVGDKQKLRRDS